MEMIARFGGGPETQIAFSNRMNALARELRGDSVKPEPSSLQIEQTVHALGDRLEAQPQMAADEREAVIRDYLEAASRLDPERGLKPSGD